MITIFLAERFFIFLFCFNIITASTTGRSAAGPLLVKAFCDLAANYFISLLENEGQSILVEMKFWSTRLSLFL